MLEKRNLVNVDFEVFPGFYNSTLSGEYITTDIDNVDIVPNTNYRDKVGKDYFDNLMTYFNYDKSIVDEFQYDGIRSPKYYNYSTDTLEYTCKVDIDKLKEWCVNHDEFKSYIHSHYSSCEGFISNIITGRPSVDNVLECFDLDNNTSIMMDFYILQNTDIAAAIYDTEEFIENNKLELFHSTIYYNDINYFIEDKDDIEFLLDRGLITRKEIPYYNESVNDVENIHKYYTGSNKDELLTHLKEVAKIVTDDAEKELKEYELIFDGYIYDFSKLAM